MRGRLKVAAGLGAVLAVALGGAYALAGEAITAGPICCSYTQSSYTITGGEVATFNAGGGISHSVLADDSKTLGGKPLFASAVISSGSAGVKGTQYLSPGDYDFHCAVHGSVMSSTLHVEGGTPVARPSLTLLITSGKLARVRKSGKLKTRVSDEGSDASGVALTAKRGRKTISTRRGIGVAANEAEPVTMTLTKAGKDALRGLDEVTIKLSARVDFGHPAKTKRTLK